MTPLFLQEESLRLFLWNKCRCGRLWRFAASLSTGSLFCSHLISISTELFLKSCFEMLLRRKS